MIKRMRGTIWYPILTRFGHLRVMAIFGTYLRAGRGFDPVWFRGPKTSPKVPVIYGANSGGLNPKLMMTKKKLAPPLNYHVHTDVFKQFSFCVGKLDKPFVVE